MDELPATTLSATEPAIHPHAESVASGLAENRLLQVTERANKAVLLLSRDTPETLTLYVPGRRRWKGFARYFQSISAVRAQPASAFTLARLEVAENTLKTLSRVHVFWDGRPAAKPFTPLEKEAFYLLVEATGSGALGPLPDRDPKRAVEVVTKRIEVLGEDVAALVQSAAVPVSEATTAAGNAFAAVATQLLGRAGGGMSLTAAAKVLNVSRQRVHKRIQDGTILGMRGFDGNIVVPSFQIDQSHSPTMVMEGIEHAVRPFVRAGEGGWAALQWLLDKDPNLHATPLDALRKGRVKEVARAAAAYAGDDED